MYGPWSQSQWFSMATNLPFSSAASLQWYQWGERLPV